MKSFRNKKKYTIFLTASFFIGYAQLLQAQITKKNQLGGGDLNTITTAVPFLMIAPDSRAGGMGDVGAASSPDANSVHWNPSKLAFINNKLGIAVSYTPWLRALVPDINLAYLSGYYKLGKDHTIGGSLRYFSLGDITFTDNTGGVIRQFKPNEFALDVAYARKLADQWSGGMAVRYIYSNLTGGINVQNSPTHAGQSIAVDISGYYNNKDIKVGGKDAIVAAGLNISNIGVKMSYSDMASSSDFIPINMRLGGSLETQLDDYNTFSILADINKLLVPTPPIYKLDAKGNPIPKPGGGYEIEQGREPDRSVPEGIFGSFNDAPGGFNEELREINYSAGLEYWYDKQFAVRAGYFYEHKTKGNRKFFTLGAGLKYNVFGLDFAYLIPTEQRNPLEKTLRFTLLFDFEAFKSQNNESSGTN